MAEWTLFHMRSPLNTTAGTGQIGELSKASSRRFVFSTEEPATVEFNLPGNHPQTAAIEPLVTDVLAFRDEAPVQRFRVVSRVLSKEGGVLTATFAGVSYKALLDAWIFHAGDVRSWTTPVEQTELAWTLFQQGQNRSNGNLGVIRGAQPTVAVMRTLTGSIPDGGKRPEYFQVGMKRSEAIGNIAAMINGFEWDIEPSPFSPYTQLRFNTWNMGGRNQHAVRSPLVLDDGGSMMAWTHTVTPTDFANVIRFTGAETTDENSTVKATPILPAWRPTGQTPNLPAPEGRWERDINNGDLTTQTAVNDASDVAFSQARLYLAEITCTLRRGRWAGPTQLWLGDKARLIITEPVAGDVDSYVVYVDEDVRVVEVSVDVDDLGAEDVSLSLNRPRLDARRGARRSTNRLDRLERR